MKLLPTQVEPSVFVKECNLVCMQPKIDSVGILFVDAGL